MANDDLKQAWKIPEPTLRRLPWYLAFLKLMKGKGETFVSSTQIAKEINVDPSQVAKDLSFVNISGKTRVGYDICALVDVLEDLMSARNWPERLSMAFLYFIWMIFLPSKKNSGRRSVLLPCLSIKRRR